MLPIGQLEAVSAMLSPWAVILGDNSHFSDKLVDFAERTGRQFLYFQEQPDDHWYPGAGIGAAFPQAKDARL